MPSSTATCRKAAAGKQQKLRKCPRTASLDERTYVIKCVLLHQSRRVGIAFLLSSSSSFLLFREILVITLLLPLPLPFHAKKAACETPANATARAPQADHKAREAEKPRSREAERTREPENPENPRTRESEKPKSREAEKPRS